MNEILEAVGFIPVNAVNLVKTDLLKGIDTQLEKAIECLNKK